jgi:S-DNA-T family DNA segregation ATPase FtsK/SpoIIIE
LVRTVISRRVCEVIGVACFGLALLWLVALASYSATDPVLFFSTPTNAQPLNFAGRVGAFLSELSFQVFGYAAYLVPPILVVIGWHYFWVRALRAPLTKAIGAAVLFASVSGLLSIAFERLHIGGKLFPAGGVVGQMVAGMFMPALNRTGSLILLLSILFLAVIMATQLSLGAIAAAIGARIQAFFEGRVAALKAWRAERRREQQRREVIRKHVEKGTQPEVIAKAEARQKKAAASAVAANAKASAAAADAGEGAVTGGRVPAIAAKAEALLRRSRPAPTPAPPDDDDDEMMMPAAAAASAGAPAVAVAAAAGAAARSKPALNIKTPSLPLPDPEPTVKAPAERRKGEFVLPPLALLDAPKGERKIDERELMDSARLLEDKCREFSVEGNCVQIHPGPVVTTYEFKPDAGVKYSKITGLADDLSLAMKAESVLIDRIPGKSTVGIQIPNVDREQISLRELLESEPYQRANSKLMLALGKTIHGEPFFFDLATMPHLLIAGSTGTGKSVGLNAMLTSILYRATPDDVRMIMLDPKRLELGMYEDIPHLLSPVVMDPKLAANALKWAVREMEERYKTLAAEGVRNIDQFNRNIRLKIEGGEKDEETGELPKPLPYIVVVIDELADLMMVAGNEVEESICRLAQMARAVGIHLILATQRPSVDVITGLIKANLPARISFRVSSKTDSRTILDGNGAEQLLGRGDMLFLPPASSRFIRLHGAYISEQESARLASFLRKQGRPVYDTSITDEENGQKPGLQFEKDDLYDEAARIIVQSGQASISYLQRRLRIGFSRAARLVDMMEADGLVSSGSGGKAREVLVSKDYFDEVDAQVR